LNLKSLAPVELKCEPHLPLNRHQRDGLRPGSTRRARALSRQVADANESLRTATSAGRTASVFGELEVQGELTKRAWANS